MSDVCAGLILLLVYCRIIIVRGGPVFVAFVGNPCPQNYILTNVYTVYKELLKSQLCHQRRYVPTNQEYFLQCLKIHLYFIHFLWDCHHLNKSSFIRTKIEKTRSQSVIMKIIFNSTICHAFLPIDFYIFSCNHSCCFALSVCFVLL